VPHEPPPLLLQPDADADQLWVRPDLPLPPVRCGVRYAVATPNALPRQ